MKKWLFDASVLLLALIIGFACQQRPEPDLARLQNEIAKGEKIFAEKECGKCHMSSEMAAGQESQAPDLSSVFLVIDTTFVKTHLQFVELSQMPPIELTPKEINALTQYVASLHAKARTSSTIEEPDGMCPVCGAALIKSEAEANHLKVSYQGKDYYFECPDCKTVFERDPATRSQSGYAMAAK